VEEATSKALEHELLALAEESNTSTTGALRIQSE